MPSRPAASVYPDRVTRQPDRLSGETSTGCLAGAAEACGDSVADPTSFESRVAISIVITPAAAARIKTPASARPFPAASFPSSDDAARDTNASRCRKRLGQLHRRRHFTFVPGRGARQHFEREGRVGDAYPEAGDSPRDRDDAAGHRVNERDSRRGYADSEDGASNSGPGCSRSTAGEPLLYPRARGPADGRAGKSQASDER